MNPKRASFSQKSPTLRPPSAPGKIIFEKQKKIRPVFYFIFHCKKPIEKIYFLRIENSLKTSFFVKTRVRAV